MTSQTIRTHMLPNGLTLVVEPMADVRSAAFSLLVPGGSLYDPPGENGTAAVLTEQIMRGAAGLDSKQLSGALDDLGVQRHENVGVTHIGFTGATLAENLPATLRLYGDILRRPRLPEDEFDASRAGVEQSLLSLEDEPRQKVIVELRRRCYDAPWGLPTDGTLEHLPALTADSVAGHYRRCFRPNGAILGIAGHVEFDAIRGIVEDVFGDWETKDDPGFETSPGGPPRDHLEHESTQTHIGIAYPGVTYRDPDYYPAWAAVSVLSGGMSSRLFTEVREKRGLVYNVYATLHTLREQARVLCYAGTTAERAQETLDVTLAELVKLRDGIGADELDRCKARAKSSLIMQQESTLARSSSIAWDWFHLGRVMTLAEIRAKIEGLTVPAVLDYVHRYPARDFTVLTIGPQRLEFPHDFS